MNRPLLCLSKLSGVVSLPLILSVSNIVVAADNILIVDSSDRQGWIQSNQSGLGSVEITDSEPYGNGTGSLEFTTTDTPDGINATKAILQPLSSIEEIGYSYYTAQSPLAPALQIEYFSLTPYAFGTLVYEPANQGLVTPNFWTDDPDASTGVWFNTAVGPDVLLSLDGWQSELGDVTATFIHVRVGSGWEGNTLSYADLVRIQYTGEIKGTTWDFEDGPISAGASVYYSLAPCRLASTNRATDPDYQGPIVDEEINFYVRDPDEIERQGGQIGGCGVPGEATSLALNVTAGQPTQGRFEVYPAGTPNPGTSLLNFHGFPVANSATLPICTSDCPNGDITVNVIGSANVILDVTGYYAPAN